MARLSRRRVVVAVRVLVIGVAVIDWAVERVQVEGDSMLPTYAPGDRLLLVRRWRRLRPGDVVAFDDPRRPGRRLVKRVATVGVADVVVRGDHEEQSTDSRSFGPIPSSSVTHLVVRRYAPATPS